MVFHWCPSPKGCGKSVYYIKYGYGREGKFECMKCGKQFDRKELETMNTIRPSKKKK